jgi:hypothetical protein
MYSRTRVSYTILGVAAGANTQCGTADDDSGWRFVQVVRQEDITRWESVTLTGPNADAGRKFCTACIDRENEGDLCAAEQICPALNEFVGIAKDGQLIGSATQVKGCRSFSPQGGFTSWFYFGGSLELKFEPKLD